MGRNYKEEYEKFQKNKSEYRAKLNKYNRDKGTYGNGDGKDASHTGPTTCKKESPKKNRTRPRKGKKYAPK